MTNREKAKWVWDHVPGLLTSGMYLLVGVVASVDALWLAIHGEWHQCAKATVLAAAVFVGAYLVWHFWEWWARLFGYLTHTVHGQPQSVPFHGLVRGARQRPAYFVLQGFFHASQSHAAVVPNPIRFAFRSLRIKSNERAHIKFVPWGKFGRSHWSPRSPTIGTIFQCSWGRAACP
jgi:hypothetical protein